jgi:hypothetical protein
MVSRSTFTTNIGGQETPDFLAFNRFIAVLKSKRKFNKGLTHQLTGAEIAASHNGCSQ